MEAWRRGDFALAAQWCQAHWYVGEAEPALTVKSWYGWRKVASWTYVKTKEVESPWPLREVTVRVVFASEFVGGKVVRKGESRLIPFICGHDQADGQPVPLDQPGAWGANPSSGLRGLS